MLLDDAGACAVDHLAPALVRPLYDVGPDAVRREDDRGAGVGGVERVDGLDAESLEIGDHALVVDDLAQGMGRLARRTSFLRLVDRLAHPVAEASAAGDPDLTDRSHLDSSIARRFGIPRSVSAHRGSLPFAPYGPRWRGSRSAAILRMISVVASRFADFRSISGGSRSTIRNGVPTRTVAWPPSRGIRRPFGQTRSVFETPIGTIVAPVRSASIASPSFGGWSSAVGLRVPSGKTISTSPASRTRVAMRKASTSAAARSTGTTPPLRAIQPTIGQSNISFLPSPWIRRPSRGVSHPPTRAGSALGVWLAARMTA